ETEILAGFDRERDTVDGLRLAAQGLIADRQILDAEERGHRYRFRNRGFRISSYAREMTKIDMTNTDRAKPGGSTHHQAVRMAPALNASLSMRPQLSACTSPKPRNDS